MTVVESVGQRLRLSQSVQVDFHGARESARQVIAGLYPVRGECDNLVDDLSKELLPGWSEDWQALERERWDQMRVRALESLAQQFQTERQYLPALQTALAAVSVDPFRDTAQRIVIEVHIAEGNFASALKRYKDYRAFLRRELNVAPSPQMTKLAQELMST
ncbi:AfsR/SARP family transcriptional regulator [Streptomyces sp. NBC_01262]|uniref:AfsR/SARP family transcriptional regulator n=1 Tax=Streptomyces sp. NBC_01262 TaxID=2903803 RepID=UPI002E37E2B4|nr:bacterial transcriptional activator domain-containing protein [Streptomyces sp. NBC_01262]